MIYSERDRTAIETVTPPLTLSTGARLTEAHLEKLARLPGSSLGGDPVEVVALLFLSADEANAWLPAVRRLGLECRALEKSGEVKVLHPGSRTRREADPEKGPLLPILREESFPQVELVVHRRLFAGSPDPMGPWVTFGWDTPKAVVRMPPEDANGRSVADVEEEACANLARRTYTLKDLDPGVQLVEEYGSEMILLPEVLRRVQSAVGADLIAIGVPTEGGFIAASAVGEDIRGLIRWTRETFDQAKGRRISPLPFLASDGALQGFVSPRDHEASAATAQEGKRPWWKFW